MEYKLNGYKKIIIYVAVSCYILLHMLFPEKSVISNMSKCVLPTLCILFLYDKWLWRINPFDKTPKLHKKYRGSFISDYDNKRRDVEIAIKQTLFSTKVYLKTGESGSKTIMSGIHNEFGASVLSYTYINTPDMNVRERSGIHYGTCRIDIQNPEELKGQYFTDRKTRGDIELKPI